MRVKRIIKVMVVAAIISAGGFAFTKTSGPHIREYKIEQLVKRISSPDTTYVVNFWATWCKPCVAELPEFEKLNADSANTKLKVILVSMDFAEDMETRLKPFVQKNNMKCEVVLLNEHDATSFIPKLDDRWSGSIPATLVKLGEKKIFAEKKLKGEQLIEMIREAEK